MLAIARKVRMLGRLFRTAKPVSASLSYWGERVPTPTPTPESVQNDSRLPNWSNLTTYPMNQTNKYTGPLKAAILDWSGTTVDKYVIAPAIVFYNVFIRHGVPITMEEARKPMGLRKDLHIAQILEIPEVKERWTEAKGQTPSQSDVDDLFADFVPMQLECLPEYAGVLPETVHCVDILREHYNLKIGGTTGFTEAMVDVILDEAKKQGYVPDAAVAGDQVSTGARPTPHMVNKNLDLLDIHPIQSVVKVDDTVGGVGEGLNAGCWSVGIARYSNYMNINSYDEEAQLSENELQELIQHSREVIMNAGPHYVIDTLEQLPAVVEHINYRMMNLGDQPSDPVEGYTYFEN